MLKNWLRLAPVTIMLLGLAACNGIELGTEPTLTPIPIAPSTPNPTNTPEPTYTLIPTDTPVLTFTPSPIPTNTLTPSPTPTATPKPVTHANIGWEEYDQSSRPTFDEEEVISNELLRYFQPSTTDFDDSFTAGQRIVFDVDDLRYAWLDSGNELYWRPYVVSERSEVLLYFLSYETDISGIKHILPHISKLCFRTYEINVTKLIDKGFIENITDIALRLNEKTGQVQFGIEAKNGANLWFAEELCNRLISYDRDIEGFGLPAKPTSAYDSALVVDSTSGEAYLFDYDENALATAGIARPNKGPTHRLDHENWQEIEEAEFIGGNDPLVAFVGVDEAGEGYLFLDERFTNLKTALPIYRASWIRGAQALAPAKVNEYANEYGEFFVAVAAPKWSPDGNRLAFVGLQDGIPKLSVYDFDSDTTNHFTTTPASSNFFYGPLWSSDGNWIIYGYGNTCTSVSLYTMSYPDGLVTYIGQGINPFWIEYEGELAVGYNPTCFVNQTTIVTPGGNESNLAKGLDLNGFVQGYAPHSKALIIHQTKKEREVEEVSLVPLNGSESIPLYSFPKTESFYEVQLSPNEKWLAIHFSGQSCDRIIDLEKQSAVEFEDWSCFEIKSWTPDGNGSVGTSLYIWVNDLIMHEIAWVSGGPETFTTVARKANDVFFRNP